MGQLHTRNCTIFFNDVEDGQFRANAVAATCESDIQKLAALFRIPFDVGDLNRAGVRVFVISPPGGGASNVGWGGILGTSDMDINGDFAPARPDAQTPTVRAEFARFLFAAELAEIMMHIAPGRWNPGSSEGEALSIVLGTELRPMGYYGAADSAPRVNAWLQSGRPDWISVTEPSDTNALSYGCGILIINYLRHQLGFDLASIIGTRPPMILGTPGGTLAARYAELTGRPPAAAYPEFMAFLEQRLPKATAAQQWVGRDDIFPLQPRQHRSAYLSAGTAQISSLRKEPPAHVTLKPGLLCGEREYAFWRVEETSQVTAAASCVGFASASFEWSINGTKLPPTTTGQRSVQVQADVSVPQPDRTVEERAAAMVQVDYLIQPGWNRSTLLIRNDGNDGIEHLNLHVSATETFGKEEGVEAAVARSRAMQARPPRGRPLKGHEWPHPPRGSGAGRPVRSWQRGHQASIQGEEGFPAREGTTNVQLNEGCVRSRRRIAPAARSNRNWLAESAEIRLLECGGVGSTGPTFKEVLHEPQLCFGATRI